MTISRAREILGDEIADLTDKEALTFIQQTGEVADTFLNLAIENLTRDLKHE